MPKADLTRPDNTRAAAETHPMLAQEAVRGTAGEFTRVMELYSEASLAAILVQYLVGFGNAIGRGPHFIVGADMHYTNEFVAVVGETAKARKGMAWNFARDPLRIADASWFADCVKSGLASGEGIIAALDGPKDKRLLAFEPELSRVLKTTERKGSVLSDILRQAWDGGNLGVMTRSRPLKVAAPHISLVGHITVDELRSLLTDLTTLNGFANRFLWVFATRQQYLPDGEPPDRWLVEYWAEETVKALTFARTVGSITRSPDATKLWRTVYQPLSTGQAGMFGAATARGEAHVMRLACLYALIDLKAEIEVEHLQAALALWRYCEDSARYIFGDAPGDPVANRIQAALKMAPKGLTRAEISELFSRDLKSNRIAEALKTLADQGQAYTTKESHSAGRPAERWFVARIE